MNKIFHLFPLAFAGLLLLSVTSCHKKELKQMRGIVTNVNINGDTLLDVSVRNGDDSLTFQLDNAKFNDGVMFPRDSVIIDYIDDGTDVYQAAVVTLLPKASKEIVPGEKTGQKLITAPDSAFDKKK